MQQNKIEAIYALRDAAEVKAAAEVRAARDPSPDTRDALLDAQLRLESTTQDAIEACHECGHAHDAGSAHASPARDNVIDVAFGSTNEREHERER